jgi:hypothetical protein
MAQKSSFEGDLAILEPSVTGALSPRMKVAIARRWRSSSCHWLRWPRRLRLAGVEGSAEWRSRQRRYGRDFAQENGWKSSTGTGISPAPARARA